ncbi:hypothetical protein [Deinococcus psychrotolerans]|uniref:hypothetical protein n=1 Tax=Deinococcus psychrotolerans TaxID=2489213 RepID=UPI001F14B4A3|nr:hypothetical protein [Deinococcus psychrotolerans]
MNLADFGHWSDAQQFRELQTAVPTQGQHPQAAALALRAGVPDAALRWALIAGERQLAAAAALRLGQTAQALELIAPLPHTARRAVLLARAHALEGQTELSWAEQARQQARSEGDASALVAAVTLLGELQLAQPYAALRTLAEGLKVAELVGGAADAHLLAVLAYAQRLVGGSGSTAKAERTAHKALERSMPRSPARIWALLALGRLAEAQAEREAGQLGAAWWPCSS